MPEIISSFDQHHSGASSLVLPDAPCKSTSFVDSLPEPFLQIARECIPLVLKGENNDYAGVPEDMTPATERADTLEVQLRSQLLSLVQESLEDDGALDDVMIFWKCSLELCLHLVYFCEQGTDERYKGMSVRKLPLLLLEDALDALPLESFKKLWEKTVEPSFPILFSDIMWNPTPDNNPKSQPTCALPFIKLCNKLLRKLHVEKGSSWPGRILLTLAKAFPLSDKSATKIWGSFNTDNITEFETEEEFDTQQKQQQEQTGGTELQLLHLQQQTKQQQQQHQHQKYSFYETFWSVQQDFSNPTGIKVADFIERMRTILAALESHPLIRVRSFNNNNNNSNKIKHENNKDKDDRQHELNKSVKYLTGSHLLPIQLGDPEFRIHFLTQFLIVEKHLSAESPALGNATLPLQKRAKDLMYHIQPHGATHLEIVDFILSHREKHWRQWKKNKCPDLEAPLVKDDDGDDTNSKKRKRIMDGPLGDSGAGNKVGDGSKVGGETTKDEEQQLIDFILHDKKDLKATCALPSQQQTTDQAASHPERRGSYPSRNTRSKVVPSLEEHLESYVDALDPDAGIEAAYHPKNDSLFTWRALRLLSRDHLQHFNMITHKGDFERMVRHIYSNEKGVQIPGEAPEEEHPSSVMETTQEESLGEGNDATEDQEMEDQDRASLYSGDARKDDSRPASPSAGTPNDRKSSVADEEGSNYDLSDADERQERKLSPVPMNVERASGDGSESEGPTREKEVNDSDDGEIEESRANKGSEPSSPVMQPAGQDDYAVDRAGSTPTDANNKQARTEPQSRGGSKDRQRDLKESLDPPGSGIEQPQRETTDIDMQEEPPMPAHKGGDGGRGGGRSKDGPSSSHNSFADKRDNSRGGGHRHRGGGGRLSRPDSRGANRGPGPGPPGGGGGRGGPSPDVPGGGGRGDDRRGMDDRWGERRGGGGGGGRRGGGGDRRGDRRGRGDSRRGDNRRR